jgi:hypothetical protein
MPALRSCCLTRRYDAIVDDEVVASPGNVSRHFRLQYPEVARS